MTTHWHLDNGDSQLAGLTSVPGSSYGLGCFSRSTQFSEMLLPKGNQPRTTGFGYSADVRSETENKLIHRVARQVIGLSRLPWASTDRLEQTI